MINKYLDILESELERLHGLLNDYNDDYEANFNQEQVLDMIENIHEQLFDLMNNVSVTEVVENQQPLVVPESAKIETNFGPGSVAYSFDPYFVRMEPSSFEHFTTDKPGILYINNEG